MRLCWWAVLLITLIPQPSFAGKTDSARCEEVHGILLAKTKDGWQPIKKGADIPAEAPLVALPEASLSSGGVTLEMKADIGKRGPLPVLESAIILHAPKDVDLDFTLERGIVVLDNRRDRGDAKVAVRLRGTTWTITLRPDSRLGLELYARYGAGTIKDFSGKLEEPSAQLIGLCLKGRAFLNTGEEGFGLQAPPGTALFQWDNLDKKFHAARLEKLPEFIRPMNAEEKTVFAECSGAVAALARKDRGKALEALINKEDHVSRVTGVVACGALDEIDLLLAALENEKHRDVRDQAILVLRHYLGRGPEQVGAVFRRLTAMKATPVQASLFLEMLLGFTKEQLREPATYDILLRLLDHPRLGVRELAHWHLVRVAPLERPIPYDPAAPAAERQKAIRQWRELIPEGELPPHLRDKK